MWHHSDELTLLEPFLFWLLEMRVIIKSYVKPSKDWAYLVVGGGDDNFIISSSTNDDDDDNNNNNNNNNVEAAVVAATAASTKIVSN